jgi:hypothetical protein
MISVAERKRRYNRDRYRALHPKSSDRPCDWCKKVFSPPYRTSRWCSRQCGWLAAHAAKPKRIVSCRDCGMEMPNQTPLAAKARCTPCRTAWKRDNDRRRRLRRRALIVPGAYTLREIAERQNWTCGLCGEDVDSALSGMDPFGGTIDHLTPLSQGGLDTPDNVQLAHRQCNTVRGAKPLPIAPSYAEWLAAQVAA